MKAKFADTAKITVLAKTNPKTPKTASYDRFKLYYRKGCKTVADALKLGITRGDIRWDVAHGFIAVK
jgi:hypothetical protein